MSKNIKNSIKTLRLYNFKSYKGLIEIGPFFSGLNSVIGPNGSGKSNLFDSILFVMGKKASQMRFKRLHDIIYLYTLKKDNFSSVAINFNSSKVNAKGRKILFKEVYFSRKIFSRFSSIYFINGKEISFLVYKKIAGNLNFLIKNDRFLIQQGEVEKISSMKPQACLIQEIGFLEFIEDSLGSTKYVEFLVKRKIKGKNFSKDLQIDNWSNKKKIKNQKSMKNYRKNQKFKALKKVFGIIQFTIFKRASKIIISSKRNFLKQVSVLNVKILFGISQKKFIYCKKKSNFLGIIKAELLKNQKNIEKNIEEFLLICKFFKYSNIKKKLMFYKNQKENYTKTNRFFFKMNQNKKKNSFYLRLKQLFLETYFLNQKISIFYVLNTCSMNRFFDQRKILKNFEKNQLIQKIWKKNLEEYRYLIDFFLISLKKGILKIVEFFFLELKKVMWDKKKNFPRKKEYFYYLKLTEILRGNFDFVEKILIILGLTTFSEKKNRIDGFIKNFRKTQYLYLNNIKKNLVGINGTIGASCFTTLFFLFPVLSVLGGEIHSILIDTTINAQNAAEFFEKNDLNRTRFVIQEKIKSSLSLLLHDDYFLNQKVLEKIYFKQNNLQIVNHFFFDIIVVKNLEIGINCLLKKKFKKKIVTLKGDSIDSNGIFVGAGVTKTDYFTHLKERKSLKWLKDYFIYLAFFTILENFFIKLPRVDNKKTKDILSGIRLILDKKKKNKFLEKFQGYFQLKYYRNFSIRYLLLELKENFSASFSKNKFKKKIQKKNLDDRKNIMINSKLRNIVYLMILFFLFRSKKKVHFIKKNYPMFKKKELNSGQHRKTKIKKFISIKEKKAAVEKFKSIKISFQILFKLSREFHKIQFYFSILSKLKIIRKFFCNILYKNINIQKKKFVDNFEKINKSMYFNQKNLKKKIIKIKIEIKKFFFTLIPFTASRFFFSKNKKIKNSHKIMPSSYKKVNSGFLNNSMKNLSLLQIKMKMGNRKILEKQRKKFFLLVRLKWICYDHLGFSEKICSKKNLLNVSSRDNHTEWVHLHRVSDFVQILFLLSETLKITYSSISLGGIMEFDFLDQTDPYSQGLLMSVRPPEKTWRPITSLSGGEKTLSSLALIFSLQIVKPTLLYLLDEIDAALDFKNVSKIASHIYFYSLFSQILVISLRNSILTESDCLFGLIKIFGETKVISIKNSKH